MQTLYVLFVDNKPSGIFLDKHHLHESLETVEEGKFAIHIIKARDFLATSCAFVLDNEEVDENQMTIDDELKKEVSEVLNEGKEELAEIDERDGIDKAVEELTN